MYRGPDGVGDLQCVVSLEQFQGVVVRVHGGSQVREVETFWEKQHSYWMSHEWAIVIVVMLIILAPVYIILSDLALTTP